MLKKMVAYLFAAWLAGAGKLGIALPSVEEWITSIKPFHIIALAGTKCCAIDDSRFGVAPLAMSSPSPAAAASERGPAPDVGEGWTTEEVTRKGGKTAGSKDKYWYSPSGKKFRSKAEIGRYKDALATLVGTEEEGDEDAAWRLFKGAKSTPSSSAKGKGKGKSAASAGTTSSRSSGKKKKAASVSPKKKAAAADSSDDDFEKPKAKGKKSKKKTASAAKVQVGLARAFAASSKKKRPAAESDDGGEEKKEDEDGVAAAMMTTPSSPEKKSKKMVARKSQKAGKPVANKVRILCDLKYFCLCNSCTCITNTCQFTTLFTNTHQKITER